MVNSCFSPDSDELRNHNHVWLPQSILKITCTLMTYTMDLIQNSHLHCCVIRIMFLLWLTLTISISMIHTKCNHTIMFYTFQCAAQPCLYITSETKCVFDSQYLPAQSISCYFDIQEGITKFTCTFVQFHDLFHPWDLGPNLKQSFFG